VFLWLNKLLLRGSRKVLGMNDLYPLDHTITSENLHPRIWLEWQKPGKKGRRGLLLALARSLGWSLFTPMPARLALSAFNFCQPLLINGVLSYLQSDTKSRKVGFGWMGATAIVYLGMSISQALYGYQRVRMQTMVRGFLVSAIFRKTTELKVTEVDNSASATLMSGDALHVEQVAYIVYDLSIIPIEFAVALALLQRQVGLGSLLQLLVVGLSFAASIGIGRASRNNRREMMKRIQLRVGSTANVISNMKSLKISGLAKEVADVIQGLRDKELDSAWVFRAFIMAAAGVAWVPIYISPVLVFAVARKSLSTTRIFTAWSYLSLLNTPLTGFFQDLPRFIASMTSVDRIAAYLELDPAADYRKDISSESNTEKVTESGDIEKTPSCGKPASSWAIQSGYFGWKEDKDVLKDINISILTTGLTLVVGPVASGKSTLCKALLGEIPFAKGDVFFSRQRSRVGFCDQIVFLPNGSIRDIIVGFSDFDDAWYSTVLDATALVPDLNTFEDGDQTKVGTKGVALSGGQRQRLTIARALYARPDLLVFDDIFSGLDQKTEVAIFDRIFGAQGILKRMETPVLLCTHSIKHLAAADYIIALSADGTISEQGKYEDLLANEGYVFSLSRKSYIGGDNESGSESAQEPKDQNTASVSETSRGQRLEKSKRTKEATTKKADPVNDQSRQKGDFSVYSYYFSMAGYWLLVPFIAFPVIFGFFLSFSNVWLTYWSNYTTAHPVYGQTQSMYLGIFALIQVMTLMPLMIFGFFATLPIATRTGRNFHIKALNTLMAAPLTFFTTTDTGVTTNRFSQDMSMLDMNITFGLFIIAEICATIGQAIIIAITSPFIAISFPILGGMLYCVQQFYLKTSRQLRLLDLESKSPLL
jgi:ABC-type multidrug transport system fused ATPase/permease subunit